MTSEFAPLTIVDQGSFFVGGRTVSAPGRFDPRKAAETEEGQSFPLDHAFVRYQIPAKADRLPVVMVHGQGQFSKTWETTPDGREGFATLFLRRGHPVYLVDFPRRGGAGLPSFKATPGMFGSQEIVPNKTMRFSNEEVFVYFRLGAAYGEYFPGTQFAKAGLDQFLMQNIAHFQDDYDVIARSIGALFDKIGAGLLLTHSQSGHFGWRAAMASENIRAIASYEPGPLNGCYFPQGQAPQPMPLFDGSMVSFASEVEPERYRRLTEIPIHIVHGDYIDSKPIENRYLDLWRVRECFVRKFCEVLNAHGGKAEFVSLPEIGITGNSHFPISDLNNREIANLTFRFLEENGY
jgi:hypothetical protein